MSDPTLEIVDSTTSASTSQTVESILATLKVLFNASASNVVLERRNFNLRQQVSCR